MSQHYYGRDMDRPSPASGSVRRARERVQAGVARETLPLQQLQMGSDSLASNDSASTIRPSPTAIAGSSRLKKPRPQPAGDAKAGQKIPRPMRMPQWPLPGPAVSTVSSAGSGPSPGRSPQAPQRPPRPSNLPSILYQSQPSPSSIARSNISESPQETDDGYNVLSPAGISSRQTTSSVGSIPDFPVPVATNSPGPPPRRSAILGPPPSSRRGASSFYSNASLVSPIPEESPRSRSHGSYASSAAMPEGWGSVSPMASPGHGSPGYGEAFYDDSATDRESSYDDFGDESRLVRSASIGKKGKPALVNTRSASSTQTDSRPPSPMQSFARETGYMDTSTSSSNTLPTTKPTPATTPATTNQTGLTPDVILKAYAAASSSDLAEQRAATGSPSPRPPNRLSIIRRPPKLDIDAVRAAEARGSLTSLPDLIRRATRLASMIEKGKRPGSRMDDLGPFLNEKNGAKDGEGSLSADDRHHSGLSDMLAAFPPPVQTPRGNRHSRASWLRPSSWPAVADQAQHGHSRSSSTQSNGGAKKQGRRCCGLPLWAFVLVVIVLLCIIVAAIVVPLEFFVFKNLGKKDAPDQSLEDCQKSLACLNGGTNLMSQDMCSCICTNGFTGSNCAVAGSLGCTTTNLVATDGSTGINNVTLGRAIPRLIAEANSNFSIPLSGTIILAKLNSASLSCIAQNSLVTFDGRSTRAGQATDEVEDVGDKRVNGVANVEEEFPPISIISFTPPTMTTTVILQQGGQYESSPVVPRSTVGGPTSTPSKSTTSGMAAPSTSASPSTTSTSISGFPTTTGAPIPVPTGMFTVTEEVIDFARVAMLYILQEESVDAAENAQTELQRFFSRASRSKTQLGSQVTQQDAAKVAIGGDNSIDLVDFAVDIGKGPVGRKNVKRAVEDDEVVEDSQPGLRRRAGGSVLP
ncbi:hypothetical protein TOPH_05422 [Tolypocladium ophioglossoides CBS 100239]|uniref:EGF-like domain-containing protein n=1 Tax=Tolypocladium ophioglossoides (strain CBS 100239) TaxID=1163406 RepID=A0A0L0N708_TOLOC|nr:hypothetical protein TOPH_05422 [Tolypocladium ophioglossoides CBS 100239]